MQTQLSLLLRVDSCIIHTAACRAVCSSARSGLEQGSDSPTAQQLDAHWLHQLLAMLWALHCTLNQPFSSFSPVGRQPAKRQMRFKDKDSRSASRV